MKFDSAERRPLIIELTDNHGKIPERLAFPLAFKKDMFKLEFSGMMSDKSTSDNFVSDEDPLTSTMTRTKSKGLTKIELEQEGSR